MAAEEKRVRDIMARIEEYVTVDEETQLNEALGLLKKNLADMQCGAAKTFHKTMLVKDAAGEIVGKLSVYDLIRALVPEPVKSPEFSRAYYSVVSSRALEVADEVSEIKSRHQWLHNSFTDLVKQETRKKVKDVMSPVYPLLEEDDSINKAIYIIFKEDVRQPLVLGKGRVVGVLRLIDIFPELLEIAGD